MLKLLIVDDEKMTRDVLANFIPWNAMGIGAIEEAEDGLMALNMALRSKPDIILSDVKMPRMDGIQLAENLRMYLPNCKIIFLSGYSDKEYLKSAIKLKATDYVEKPVNLDEVKQTMETAINELKIESRERESRLIALRQKLCLDLISNNADIASAKEKAELLGLDFPENGQYVASIIKFSLQCQEAAEECIAPVNQNLKMLEDAFSQVRNRFVASTRGEDQVVLLCGAGDNILCPMLDEFIKRVKEECVGEMDAMVAVGKTVAGMGSISNSYQTATIALKRLFYKGYGYQLTYSEGADMICSFDESMLALFSDSVKSGNKAESLQLIRRLCNDIRKQYDTPPDRVKNFFFKMILVLSRIAEDRNISFLNQECKLILESVSKANTLDDIEKSVAELILSVITHMENRFDNGDIVAKITACISINYSNADLSISSISEALYLTSTYLCMLYKKETGKTINQYITEVRLEKAKEHLRQTDSKLYAIAEKVGFGDGKYFTKVFEKSVGMKPKQYREIHGHAKKDI